MLAERAKDLKKMWSFEDEIEIGAPEGIRTPIDGTGNHNSIH